MGNILDGDDLKNGADFLKNTGKGVGPLLDSSSGILTETAKRLKPGGLRRKARKIEKFAEGTFENAEDWTSAEHGKITVHASVAEGGTTIDIPEPIEFIHFGKVHRDNSQLFHAPELDDTKAGKLVQAGKKDAAEEPAHGLMFRAALMREGVLLGGFIRAQMDALADETASKGVIGVLAQVLADMTGSAGATADKPNAVDLNPHIKKVRDAIKTINGAKVTYPMIHTCGRDLHSARTEYRKYIVEELKKRMENPLKATTPTPNGGVINDQLNGAAKKLEKHPWEFVKDDVVPRLTNLVTPDVQNFLSVVQKVSFKAWDVYAALLFEYSLRMEPVIEDASRRFSVSAIKKRSTPVFPIWFIEQKEYYDGKGDDKLYDELNKAKKPMSESGLLGGIGKAVNKIAGKIVQPVDDALHKYDQDVGIDKTLDFLARPDRTTPGRPFLDDIFMVPPDPEDPDEGNVNYKDEPMARTGWSSGLGQMAVDSLKGAIGVESMPRFLEWIVSKTSMVSSEFVRGAYGKLLTVDAATQLTEAEFIESGERHLVGNIVESVLGGLRFMNDIRKATLDLPFNIATLSVDALIGRAKEFAAQKLEKWVSPVVKYAMRDLYKIVMRHRADAITQNALTMEVHLAQLPTVFARMFRNTFFPLWDKAFERVIEGLGASLMPKIEKAVKKIIEARDEIDKVRRQIHKGVAALETLPDKLPDVGFDLMKPKKSIDKLKSDWSPIAKNAKKAYDEADVKSDDSPLAGDDVDTQFPIIGRIRSAAIEKVTEEHIKLVKPNLKWSKDAKKPTSVVDDKPKTEAPPAAPKEKNGSADPSNPTPFSGPGGQSPSPLAPSYAQQLGKSSYVEDPMNQTVMGMMSPLSSAGGLPFAPASSPGSLPPISAPLSAPSNGGGRAPQFAFDDGGGEKTQVLGNLVSPEVRKMAGLDEDTADVPSSNNAGLPPFSRRG